MVPATPSAMRVSALLPSRIVSGRGGRGDPEVRQGGAAHHTGGAQRSRASSGDDSSKSAGNASDRQPRPKGYASVGSGSLTHYPSVRRSRLGTCRRRPTPRGVAGTARRAARRRSSAASRPAAAAAIRRGGGIKRRRECCAKTVAFCSITAGKHQKGSLLFHNPTRKLQAQPTSAPACAKPA